MLPDDVIPRGAPRHSSSPRRKAPGKKRLSTKWGALTAAAAMVVVGLGATGVASAMTSHAPSRHQGWGSNPGWGSNQGWVGTWGATPLAPTAPDNSLGVPMTFTNQTLRMIVQPHIGGNTVRIRLANTYGSKPVTFDDVRAGQQVPNANTFPATLPTSVTNVPGQLIGTSTLAGAIAGAGVVPGSDVPLTFGGKPTVTVPAGQSLDSDPVALPVKPFENLAISFHLPTLTGLATEHTIGNQVNYVAPGDLAKSPSSLGFVPNGISYFFLSDVDVEAAPKARSVIALGDSLTDGLMSTINANHRYPDFLARRLQANAATKDVSVVNEGVAGQRVLYDNIGPSALNSLAPNALSQPGAKYIILQDGINDLANPPFIGIPGRHPEPISAQQVIDGMKKLIDQAHAKGVKVYATTITPSGDLTRTGRGLFETYSLPAVVAKRLAVNQWIRTSHAADAVIDFDAVLRDPASPNSIKPALASADNLHPNDAGYKVMADSIPLSLFN